MTVSVSLSQVYASVLPIALPVCLEAANFICDRAFT